MVRPVKRILAFILIVFILAAALQAQRATENVLQTKIRHYFLQRFNVPDSALKISYHRFPNLKRFNEKAYQIECRSQNSRLKLGFQTIWVCLLQNGRLAIKFPVSLELSIKKRVVVTVSNIHFHEKIQANMVQRERRWITDSDIWQDGLNDLPQVIKMETTHFLPAGKIILKRDVQKMDAVRAGDTVEIWVTAGELLVTAKGIARSAGKIGDYIYVKNIATGKRIKAKVQSPGVVVVLNERPL